jgi:(4-alkanoyl-5-oxo-2,5-dihydrofuran-3-yl)methyl phosphate reductase
MYLVTGATGNVGSEVVARLLDEGEPVRVFVRDPGKVAHWGDRVRVATGDFGEPDTFARAAAGVEGVFLMNVATGAESFRRLLDAAKAHGGPRIVFLSTILANSPEIGIGKLHKDKEDAIRESGLPAGFLRPGAFMSNAYQWAGTIRAEGVVYNPMGSGKVAPIAPDDIAAVAVEALTTPGLAGEVFELTGGELLSVPEQVEILARVLGRPIRCVDVPVETAVQGLIRGGLPAHLAAAVGQSFAAVRDGRAVDIRDTVERVTGRKPRTFEAWAREHAPRFA